MCTRREIKDSSVDESKREVSNTDGAGEPLEAQQADPDVQVQSHNNEVVEFCHTPGHHFG